MLSKTLQDGLDDYGIGAKIRALRLKQKIALVDLGKHTGLSPALLSKIERGQLFPTLPTLLRITLVFGVGLEYFFAGARDKPLVAVTRKRQRVELPERAGARAAAYRFASLDYAATERRFNCYYAEFLPVAPDKLRPHDHAGVEFIYVIQGRLSVHVHGEEHTLEAGDAILFRCDGPARISTQRWAAVPRGRRYRLVSGTATYLVDQHRFLARVIVGDSGGRWVSPAVCRSPLVRPSHDHSRTCAGWTRPRSRGARATRGVTEIRPRADD